MAIKTVAAKNTNMRSEEGSIVICFVSSQLGIIDPIKKKDKGSANIITYHLVSSKHACMRIQKTCNTIPSSLPPSTPLSHLVQPWIYTVYVSARDDDSEYSYSTVCSV